MIHPIHVEDTAEKARLDALKTAIWPEADREHYGENIPEDFFDTGRETMVYEENGEWIGYLTWKWDAGVVYLDSTAVHPQHRRKGVAKALKLELEKRAREKGCHKIWCETGLDWDSRKMNQSLGYTEVIILKRHYGQQDFVLFEKFLD